MIQLFILVGTVVCMDMSGYKRVNSEYSYLVPMNYDFNKKDFLKDGPPAPFDKRITGKNVMFKEDDNFYYQCTTPTFRSENTSYCLRWLKSFQPFATSKNNSHIEKCRCLETSMGPNYCTYWFCTQLEAAEVTGGSATSNQYEDTEFQRIINKSIDYTDCVCRYESMNSKYCQQWWCQKTKKDGTIEIEEYNCDLASNGSDFCFKWSGQIASPKVKVWSTCECNSQLMRQYHCDNWTCYEKVNGRNYLEGFIVFMVSSCLYFSLLLIILLICYQLREFEEGLRCQIFECIIIVAVGCIIGIICILSAGLIGLFAGVPWILIALLWCLISQKNNNNQNNTFNQQGGNYGSQSISSDQNQQNNGVPVGYPAPTQEIEMYSSTSGPISARPSPTLDYTV